MRITRRDFLAGAASAAGMAGFAPGCMSAPRATGATPSAAHLKWADWERGMFFHYDIPVFKQGWKWRSFKDFPDPKLYAPKKLDTDQWMEAAKAMGAKYCVLVAKHCSGFLQWQSDCYDYGCKQAVNFDGGKGDLVRRFVDSCRRYGMVPGLYASVSANGWMGVDNPGIIGKGKGDPKSEEQKRYSKICEQMARELWTNYGELGEIWFDGGALPPSEGGPDLIPILEKLQPNAILFQGPKGANNLIRWVGNERGVAPYPCWGATNTLTSEGGDREARFTGDADGAYWAPGECDVPIRKHQWFWTPEGQYRYWTIDELIEQYYRSVGRNCNLLLNANPDPDGLVPEEDMKRYAEFGREVEKRFGKPVATVEGVASIKFSEPQRVNQISIQEEIRYGEKVRGYRVEGVLANGTVKELQRGESIGHKRIQMFAPEVLKEIRVVAEKTCDTPVWRSFSAYSVEDETIRGLDQPGKKS